MRILYQKSTGAIWDWIDDDSIVSPGPECGVADIGAYAGARTETNISAFAAAIAAQQRAAALAASVYTKLQIRRAMRAMGIEATLDTLLQSNAMFAADWADAQEIDLADPQTALALAQVSVDLDAIKLKIAGISPN